MLLRDISPGELSVFGMHSVVTEDTILFSEEKCSVCSFFFFIGIFSPMGYTILALAKNKRYNGIENVRISEFL